VFAGNHSADGCALAFVCLGLSSSSRPARFKAASCKAVLWSSVDTRAYPYFMG
jgi:hypothetical protein